MSHESEIEKNPASETRPCLQPAFDTDLADEWDCESRIQLATNPEIIHNIADLSALS